MDSHNRRRTQEILEREEGRRSKPYKDSKGILTIGVGWNLEEHGLPADVIDTLLRRSMDDAEQDARRIPEFANLNGVRKGVLIRMVFQMGLGSVLGFENMRAALDAADYHRAADEMLDSQWYREDTPGRARRESEIMRKGYYDDNA